MVYYPHLIALKKIKQQCILNKEIFNVDIIIKLIVWANSTRFKNDYSNRSFFSGHTVHNRYFKRQCRVYCTFRFPI